jgi:hypothetical protein
VLILAGLLRHLHCQDTALALLSALADVPVDQHGLIQAIGAVNEKIEGFFALCRERGLTGDQGVVIPAQRREIRPFRPFTTAHDDRGPPRAPR